MVADAVSYLLSAVGLGAMGGLLGSRLARPLVTWFGQHQILLLAGALRALWPVGLAGVLLLVTPLLNGGHDQISSGGADGRGSQEQVTASLPSAPAPKAANASGACSSG
ncbi:hypothetical protein GCM10009555_095690 [Acrocarpospora macrocephala]|uniref:Uncharacterized protein n=1 Tax=Acrocarpospora macrocephala TaxID=150177 RepID=A0A5M3WLG1_9ACTN|nr:hypothetical protein [Acrocarpospora macrocephala]GES09486.1 hypothetical protein Amac_030820 [Acrocarpospora macrocephala]